MLRWILPLGLLAACSGGGGGSPPPITTLDSVLFIDTSAATEDSLRGHLLIAALERSNGTFTDNLLASGGETSLAAPVAAGVMWKLQNVPEGTYVALRLAFLPASVRHRDRDGREREVELAQHDLRVEIEDGFHHGRGGDDWLELRHTQSLELRPSVDRVSWTPHFRSRQGTARSCGDLSLRVLSGDRSTRTLLATHDSRSGAVPLQLVIAQDAALTDRRDFKRLTLDEFFARATTGRKLQVRGTFTQRLVMQVSAAELHSTDSSQSEQKVYGRLLSLDGGTRFTLQVTSVERGSLGGSQLPQLQFDAGSARIHRSHSSDQPLPFSALQVGQRLEVEWNGPASQAPIAAREVEIEDDPSGGSNSPEIEGAVGQVLVAEAVLVAVPRRDDPLLVGGRSVASARILIDANTYLFRDDSAPTRISLAQVRSGERVWIRGSVNGDGSVRASWVRVRNSN